MTGKTRRGGVLLQQRDLRSNCPLQSAPPVAHVLLQPRNALLGVVLLPSLKLSWVMIPFHCSVKRLLRRCNVNTWFFRS
uniref:Uncharacterized protein n=1 Tax=Anguilla anguilla TaxID=7936 RepID=A0A0E9XZ05_ANGAN